MIEILLAFIAGILTIAAPCILLPLPIILGGSVGQQSKTRPIFITLGFIISFATLALAINFLVTRLGLDPNTLRNGAVVMLGLFAIFMIWPTPFERLMTHMSGLINRASKTGQTAGNGNFGGFILGVIIGIVWAPCAGPILGSILTLIALEKNLGQASILLIAYAVGSGVPMLAIAYGGQTLTTRVRVLAKYSARLQQVFGVILLGLAFAIYFQYDTLLQAKLVEKLPSLQGGFEQSIKDKLEGNNLKEDSSRFDKKSATSNKNEATQKEPKTDLWNFGKAPELTGITNWINSEPLTLAELKGKVVLIDFWTYSCINCIRTLPYITKWYDTYKDKGLVVIGVHSPEFAFEKLTSNVETAIKRHKINYPVAQDNNFATWQAYENEFWPAHYLIDQNGDIVYTHFGEGKYELTENNIRALLGLDASAKATQSTATGNRSQSPEMYFGKNRLKNLVLSQVPLTKSETLYTFPVEELPLNTFALYGEWKFYPEYAVLAEGSEGKGGIRLRFLARQVNIVAGSSTPLNVRVQVDGVEQPSVMVHGEGLYQIFNSSEYKDRTLDILIPSEANFKAFTFTFG